MSYTLLTNKKSPSFTPNNKVKSVWGVPRTFKEISIHWWGDPNANYSFEGVVNTLCTASRKASAHYVATGTGRRVARLVDESDASWATNSANPWTISIECDPRCRPEDYEVVAELIRDIRSRHGNLPLVPHKKYANTACPGNWDLKKLDQLAKNTMKLVQVYRNEGDATVRGTIEYDTMEEVNATGLPIILYGKPSLIKEYGNPEVSLKVPIPTFDSVTYLGLTPEKNLKEDTRSNDIKNLTTKNDTLYKEIDTLDAQIADLQKQLDLEKNLHDDTAQSSKEIIAEYEAKIAQYEKEQDSDAKLINNLKDRISNQTSFTEKVVQFIKDLFTKK